jgi:hypothetical protein
MVYFTDEDLPKITAKEYDESMFSSPRDVDYDVNGWQPHQSSLSNYCMTPDDDTEEMTPEEIKKNKKKIKEDTDDVITDIEDALEKMEFLSKKEKKAVKRVLMKRLDCIRKEFEGELDKISGGMHSWILDIENELDDKLQEFKDAMSTILDIEDLDYEVWPKSWHKRTIEKTDYMSDIPETKSDQRLKIKVDKESLEAFLCQSHGGLENIAMITAENREFDGIENMVFRIVPVEDRYKKRLCAFTEADGKAIADMMTDKGLVKCGWIHTHPFGKTSIFFSGTDVTNTKEMCVFPDDYALAIVVGCKYSDPISRLEDGNKVIDERKIEWSLGSMVYQKKSGNNDKIIRLNADTKDMTMVKFDTDIEIVDSTGKPTEYQNLSQDNSIMEDRLKSTFLPGVQIGLEHSFEYCD